MLGLAGAYVRSGSFAPVSVAVLLQAAALWWRRGHPEVVLIAVSVGVLAEWLLLGSLEPSGIALLFAVYAVSVYGRADVRIWVAAAAIVLVAVAVGSLLFDKFALSRATIPIAAPSLVAWVVGDYIRSRRRYFQEMVVRASEDREKAAEEERLRIARELHDVVAHNVSVMAIQAGAARVSGNSTKEVLESIERSARETLSELNKLLGVLRKTPGAPDLMPQPTLDDVEVLLKPLREAGVDATLRVIGEKRALPAAVDLSGFRIVQEAITNVLKHAYASRVEVTLDYRLDALAVTVSDNGTGATQPIATSTGHGLIGMRERVEVLGGELGTGSSSLGGFTVRAKLPISA